MTSLCPRLRTVRGTFAAGVTVKLEPDEKRGNHRMHGRRRKALVTYRVRDKDPLLLHDEMPFLFPHGEGSLQNE